MTKNGCCGRGILAFETYKPARRPGERLAARSAVTTSSNGTASKPPSESEGKSTHTGKTTNQPQVPIPPVSDGKRPIRLLAKYNYKANPNRPGGFDELSLKQAERLQFIQAHPANPFWWEATNSDGQSGYVPASYLMVLEEKPSSLPWLEQKREAEKKEEEEEKDQNKNPGVFGPAPPATFKPYVSAYNKVEKTPQQERQWYCELCCKQLNGPQPYQAHMVSRAHKDELEAQGLS